MELCAEANSWETLNDEILAFSKKHGQLKAAIQGMVEEAWNLLKDKDWVAEGKLEERGKLIETLRVVTEGKVHNAMRTSSANPRYLWRWRERE